MKMNTTIIPIIAFVTTISSCCHKKGCPEAISRICFENFNVNDIDTLLFSRFTKNSNFTSKIDSSFYYTYQSNANEPKSIDLVPSIDTQNDWEIKLVSTQIKYRITDIITRKEVCNSCIAGNDYYTMLASCKVNGIIRNEKHIVITK